MRTGLFALFAITGMSSSLVAAPLTINAGSLSFTVGDAATSMAPLTDLRGGATSGDLLYQSWWWIRTSAASKETPLRASSALLGLSKTSASTLTLTSSTSTYRAAATWTLESTAPGVGALRMRIAVTNLSNSTLALSLWNYADPDLNDLYSDDAAARLNSGVIRFTDGQGPYGLDFAGAGASSWSLGEYGALAESLGDNAKTTLANSPSSIGPSDTSAAFGWALSLPRGNTQTIEATMTLIPSPGPASLVAMGGLLILGRRRRARA